MKKLLLSCFSVAMIFTLNTGLVHAEQEPDSTPTTTETDGSTMQDTEPQTTIEANTNEEEPGKSVKDSTGSEDMQEHVGVDIKAVNSDPNTSSSSSAEVASSTTPDQSEVSAPAKVNTLSPEASDAESNDTVTEQYDACYNGVNYTELKDAIDAAVTALNSSSEPASATITVLRDLELRGAGYYIGGGTDDQAYQKVMIKNGSLIIDFNGHSAIFARFSGTDGVMGYPLLFNVSSGNLILKNGVLHGRPNLSYGEEENLRNWLRENGYYPSFSLSGRDAIGFWDQTSGDQIINGERSITLDRMKVENILFTGAIPSELQKGLTINSSVLDNCNFTWGPDTTFNNSYIANSIFSEYTPWGKFTFNRSYLKNNKLSFLATPKFTDTLAEGTMQTNEQIEIWNPDIQKNETKSGTSFDNVTIGEGNIGYEIQDDTKRLSEELVDQMKTDSQKNQYLFVSSADLVIDWGDKKDHSNDNIKVTIQYPNASNDVKTSLSGNDKVTVAIPDFTINGYDADSFSLNTTPTDLNSIAVQYDISDALRDLYDFNVEKQADENGHITIKLAATKKKYTISYDPAEGTWEDGSKGLKTVSADKDTAQTILPAPSRTGYKFLYWKGSQFNPGQAYDQTNTYGHYTDHQLTAVWEALPSPTPSSNSSVASVKKAAGTTIATSNYPSVKRFIPKTGAGMND